MRIKKGVVFICSFMLLLNLAGCGKEAQKTVTKESFTPVKVAVLQKSGIEKVDKYTGQLKPIEEIEIVSKVPGKVQQVNFDIGDRINKNDVLFSLEKKSVENTINQIRSQVQSAEAQVNLAQISLNRTRGSMQERKILDEETALRNAKLACENAEKDYKNTEALYEAGAVSENQYDQAKDDYDSRKKDYENAQKKYELLMEKQLSEDVNDAKGRLDQAVASRNASQAQLENSIQNLQDLQVKSPIKGVVAKCNVNVGEMTGSGAAAFKIINMDTVCVTIQVPEKMINKFQLNQNVDVYVKAAQEQPFTGVVKKISPVADEMTMTYPIKIEIENKQGIIKPGMFAEIVYTLQASEDSIVVPRNVLKLEEDAWFAYIVENNAAKKVQVEVGIDNGSQIEIKNGLKEGQQLIVQGKEYVIEGEQVEIVK